MNVFYTDTWPTAAARGVADRHVNKMILEVAQMLSTVVRVQIGDDAADARGLYRATHKHHPCVRHMMEDAGYLAWVYSWGGQLYMEKCHRTGASHKSVDVILHAGDCVSQYMYRDHLIHYGKPPASIPLAMPEEFWPGACRLVSPDEATAAYRRYLASKYRDWDRAGRPPKWTNAEAPAWVLEA